MKTKIQSSEKLYFIQDLSSCQPSQVYSGRSGTDKNFTMYQGDYGKYAMKPQTKERCEQMITEIEKDAKGRFTFNWNIVPMTDIDLCNFYSDAEYKAYKTLQTQQKKLK